MRGAGQWLEALSGAAPGPVRILFARLGLVAVCRPLSSGELAECIEMGGERGARYALYLACDSLRQAGEQRVARGEALSPLDITEGLVYSDILAAAGIIAGLSGAGPALVRQLDEEEDPAAAIAAGMDSPAAGAAGNPFAAGRDTAAQLPWTEEPTWTVGQSTSGDEEEISLWVPEGEGLVGGAESSVDVEPDWGPAAGTGHGSRAALDSGAALGGPRASGDRAAGLGWAALGGSAVAVTDPVTGSTGRPGGTDGVGDVSAQADALARVLADRLRDAAGNM